MAWVRIDDCFDEHPKLQRVGPLAWGFWLAGLAYCNRNLTDGFIPWSKARTLCSFEVADEDGTVWELCRASGMSGEDVTTQWVIDLLTEVGLWELVENGRGRIDGYRVHDYDQYQPTKAQVEADREATARRQAEWRERRSNAKDNGASNGVTNVVSIGVTNAPVTGAPNPNPNPNPSIESDKSLSKGRSRTLSDEWKPTEPMLTWAETEFGFDTYRCGNETEKFRDYHNSKGNAMKDWNAAWRNWIRNSVQYSGGVARGKNRPPNPRPDDYVWDDQYSEWRMPDKVGWGG
jgi:hypothetical protein